MADNTIMITIGADGKAAMAEMGNLVKSVESGAMEMTTAFEGVSASMGKIGTLLTSLAAGAGLAELVKDSQEWNLGAMKMANTMGVTTEQASVMAVALHGLGISNDVAESASLKLSKTLASGTDKFDQFGISVKDSNGNLLPLTQIMANVNTKLLETQSGADRNIMAMTLYGRTWKELQPILRLNKESMDEAQETATRLHLIVGPEGVAQALAYKKNMNELHLTLESFALQVGGPLIAELTKLAAWFTGVGGHAIGPFIEGLHSAEAEIMRMSQLADKAGGSMTSLGMMLFAPGAALGNSNSKTQFEKFAQWNIDFESNYNDTSKKLQTLANLEVGLDENGNPIKNKSKKPSGDRIDAGGLNTGTDPNANYDRLVHAAHQKYLDYLKAFAEEKAAIVKNANALEEAQNQNAYDKGLVDLRTFLETKHALNEEALYAELAAKKTELANAQAAEKAALKAYAKDPTGESAGNVNAAAAQVEKAKKSVSDAESKMNLARQQNNITTTKQITDMTRAYQEQHAAFLETQNDFVGAAAIRKQLAEEDQKYNQLVANAMTGDKAAMQAFWDFEAQQQLKSAEATYKQTLEYKTLAIQIMEMTGEYEKAAIARQKLEESNPAFQKLPKDVQDQKRQLSANAGDQAKWKETGNADSANVFMASLAAGGHYSNIDGSGADLQKAQLKKQYDDQLKEAENFYSQDEARAKEWVAAKAKIDQNYKDSVAKVDQDLWTTRATTIGNSMQQISQVMMKGNKEQFEAGKDLAIATATIQMFATEAAIINGITASTSGWGFAAAIAQSIAAGAVFAGTIASISQTQYQGRADGGPVDPFTTYLVGERGPELISMGSQGGTVTPNHALGGHTYNVSITQHLNITGVGADLTANMRTIAGQAKDQAKTEILNSMQRGTEFAQAAANAGRKI
ncbi:MAG: hypothetical protein ABSA86_13155 [Oryzomonas sp.]|jgi:hypothetical protein